MICIALMNVLFQSLLESCIVHGVWLSLNLNSSLDYSTSVEQQAETNITIHPLFEVRKYTELLPTYII